MSLGINLQFTWRLNQILWQWSWQSHSQQGTIARQYFKGGKLGKKIPRVYWHVISKVMKIMKAMQQCDIFRQWLHDKQRKTFYRIWNYIQYNFILYLYILQSYAVFFLFQRINIIRFHQKVIFFFQMGWFIC